MDDELDGPNDDLLQAILAQTSRMARGFDRLWARPDAMTIMREYIDGEIVFVVDREDVGIARVRDRTEPPPTGQYL